MCCTYKLVDMDCTFSLPEKPFEVVCAVSKKMVRHPGHTNFEDARKYAEKLASENPGRSFIVYGPMSVSKADVPVSTEVFPEVEVK